MCRDFQGNGVKVSLIGVFIKDKCSNIRDKTGCRGNMIWYQYYLILSFYENIALPMSRNVAHLGTLLFGFTIDWESAFTIQINAFAMIIIDWILFFKWVFDLRNHVTVTTYLAICVVKGVVCGSVKAARVCISNSQYIFQMIIHPNIR